MLFVKEQFLSETFCNEVLSQYEVAQESTVADNYGNSMIQKDFRMSYNLTIPASKTDFIKEQFLAAIPALEAHFKLKINNLSSVAIVKYAEGHYIKPHVDKDLTNTGPTKNRMLSAIIFLNNSVKYDEQSETAFEGGELVIYGVSPKFPQKGFPIYSKTGRIAVFPPHLTHEVTTVNKGSRYIAVAWYLFDEPEE